MSPVGFSMELFSGAFLTAALPILLLFGFSLIALCQSFVGLINKPILVIGNLYLGILSSLWATIHCFASPEPLVFLGGSLAPSSFDLLGSCLVLAIALVVALFFQFSYLSEHFFRGEISALYLMTLGGMLVMLFARELSSIFIGLELSSLGTYALLGYIVPTRRSLEAAVKYLILGSVASAFVLMGFALLYAKQGHLGLYALTNTIVPAAKGDFLAIVICLMFLVGFGLKSALAPFHLWTPDAYEGAPTGLTAFMSTASKIATVFLLIKVAQWGIQEDHIIWQKGLSYLAAFSIIAGNIMALVQTNIKRLLAYSSVAHTGYFTMALCYPGSNLEGLGATIFYLVSYSAISLGVFGILIWLESHETDHIQLEDLSGLAKQFPRLSALFALLIFSLAGFPPTAGFMAKFLVFSSALEGNLWELVIIGAIGSTISLYYYLRIIVRLYLAPKPQGSSAAFDPAPSYGLAIIIGLFAALNLYMGTVGANPVLKGSRQVAAWLKAK